MIDGVKQKGAEQIKRYEPQNPSIRNNIEVQLSNLQESYDSLLKTAHQIKARLDNSLLKFKEYEDTLDNIWSNLDELEPTIKTDVDMPQDLGKAKILMESMRVSGLLFLFTRFESSSLFCLCKNVF